MYKCQVGGRSSKPGEPRFLWPIYREDGSIEKELVVGRDVYDQLRAGIPLAVLQRKYAPPPAPAKVEEPPFVPSSRPVSEERVNVGEPISLKLGLQGFDKKPRK